MEWDVCLGRILTNVIRSNDFQDTNSLKPYDQIQESWEGTPGKDIILGALKMRLLVAANSILWYVVVAAYPMTCNGRMRILSLGCKLESF